MARPDLHQLIVQLGLEFRRLELHPQLRSLRLFYLAFQRGLLDRQRSLEVHWSERHTIEWMQMLRLPPFSHDLAVRNRLAGCPRCGITPGTVPSTHTLAIFPGGAKVECSCGATWLELNAGARRE